MKNIELSNCCKAEIKVVSCDEGTNYYKCVKCNKACDIYMEKLKDQELLSIEIKISQIMDWINRQDELSKELMELARKNLNQSDKKECCDKYSGIDKIIKSKKEDWESKLRKELEFIEVRDCDKETCYQRIIHLVKNIIK
jgi:hypothetical protein